jgi:hypothetical protein
LVTIHLLLRFLPEKTTEGATLHEHLMLHLSIKFDKTYTKIMA